MASKTVMRLESELDKCRSDANWAKVLDVAKQISSKGSQLGMFLWKLRVASILYCSCLVGDIMVLLKKFD